MYNGDCSIRVSRSRTGYTYSSWVSMHNSVAFSQILLYYCKEFLWWLLQLQIDFQLTTLNGCSIIGWIFIRKFDRVILTPDGFCVSGLFPDSFQTTKRHSCYIYSIYMLTFNSFYEAVYLVGRDNKSILYSVKNYSHNSWDLYRICTKMVRRFLLMRPFRVPSFSFILACICILQRFFQVCENWDDE